MHSDHLGHTTAEVFAVITPLDIALSRIADTYGDGDLDQVLTAISSGADPWLTIAAHHAARDAEDELFEFSATVAALADPDLLRSAA